MSHQAFISKVSDLELYNSKPLLLAAVLCSRGATIGKSETSQAPVHTCLARCLELECHLPEGETEVNERTVSANIIEWPLGPPPHGVQPCHVSGIFCPPDERQDTSPPYPFSRHRRLFTTHRRGTPNSSGLKVYDSRERVAKRPDLRMAGCAALQGRTKPSEDQSYPFSSAKCLFSYRPGF